MPRTVDGGVSIADVSRALRVPMPTLRSWELRYRIPESPRTPGKHRRYGDSEVHAIRLMRDEIARGTRASVAAQSVRSLLSIDGHAADLISAVLSASNCCDPGGIRVALDTAAGRLGVGVCIDEVLLPALRQVGQWWEAGSCDVAQEQLTTEAARAWLDRGSAFAPPPTRAAPVVLACGPGDLHTIGLEALALLLRHRGWPCRLLGSRTSTAALTTAARATDAAGVVLVSHLPTGRRRALASMDAIAALQIPLFYAGNAFNPPRCRRQLPGTYLGTSIQQACAVVDQALHRALSA